jgi:hypothetical protein
MSIGIAIKHNPANDFWRDAAPEKFSCQTEFTRVEQNKNNGLLCLPEGASRGNLVWEDTN